VQRANDPKPPPTRMAKKLSKAERAVDEAMLAMLEWASERPKHWHDIGKPP